jgi:hypothetical protein
MLQCTKCIAAMQQKRFQIGSAAPTFVWSERSKKIEIRRKARNEQYDEPDPQLSQLAPLP